METGRGEPVKSVKVSFSSIRCYIQEERNPFTLLPGSCVSWTAHPALDATQHKRWASDGEEPEVRNKDNGRKHML